MGRASSFVRRGERHELHVDVILYSGSTIRQRRETKIVLHRREDAFENIFEYEDVRRKRNI